MLKTRVVSLKRLEEEGVNPALVAGMAVVGSKVMLTEIKLDAFAVGCIPIPALKETKSTATRIRSIQWEKGLLMVSLDGVLTTPVKDALVLLGDNMVKYGMTSSFFPLTTPNKPGRKYFGFAPGNMRNVDERVHNARLLADGNGLIFSRGQRVHYLPLHHLNDDWLQKSEIIHEGAEYIKFLGRVEGDRIPVTLASGASYFMKVGRKEAIPESPLDGRFRKVFGRIGNGQLIVALSDENLNFM